MSTSQLDDRIELGSSTVEEIRRNAELRLRQIAPLLEEAERLRNVLDALGRPAKPRAARREDPRAQSHGDVAEKLTTGRKRRAASGANKRVILDLVGSKPGITVAEITAITAMKRTVVASTVSRLKRYGELCDHERGGVSLPTHDGPAAHAAGDQASDAPRRHSVAARGGHARRPVALPRERAA